MIGRLGISIFALSLAVPAGADQPAVEYSSQIQPLLGQYCLGCHSTQKHKGSLDLERFSTLAQMGKDVKRWQLVVEQLEAEEMPPSDKPQPTAGERAHLIGWVRGFLDAQARARAGDPGGVPMRRLSNAEYNYTIRDLTGVDLQPARQFPADGAGGEGFTNAAESLSDISPALLNKYLLSAKEIAAHAVLLPDGFRFSATATRRDWSDESLARLRVFYAQFTPDGRLPLQPYFAATLRNRQALLAGSETPETVAAKSQLNPKFLRCLWNTLTDAHASFPLDQLREHWRTASEKDSNALAAETAAWQGKLWKVNPIGSYRFGDVPRQTTNDALAADPQIVQTVTGKGTADDAAHQKIIAGFDEFRRAFPLFICFPGVIPVDEVVCLKMYHREDEPLIRLFLDDAQRRQIDHLWEEHRFITQQPVAENRYLPLFIGFVTQDQPKALVAYFESQREPFRKRAEAFEAEMVAAEPAQLERLYEFAGKACRRPLAEKERADLAALYQALRSKGVSHEEAFRGVLARVLVSPSFLFRIETAPPGEKAGPVNNWALATRLSYFLWSTPPDDELRSIAAGGTLLNPDTLAAQASRMLKDDRIRALGIEFGTQWIHVRGFDSFNEKSEKLYPAFDATLRAAMYEEAILFFQDLFQHDESITRILDANYAFLNDALAKYYGIPGVSGPAWRRVDDVNRFGRGGILAMGCVQAKQAGASRTSPVLRGNWVVETLLGEKLPRPPADVPRLPEEENAAGGLTMRQLVEKHTSTPSCMVCHQRIDPIGFAFERYDSVGRLRDKESSGLPIDCRAKLKDGTEFQGIDGLRTYLLTKKKDVIIRLFCRRLLGYALGRAVALSDQSLLDEMVAALDHNDGRLSAAVMVIVRSPQFCSIRGSAFVDDE